ncbi:acyl-CoA thioesterase I [Gammaproteobacteria bacterium]|nr:acyl-CoA thioesterase I [Gammaproteobacteria bacterium]
MNKLIKRHFFLIIAIIIVAIMFISQASFAETSENKPKKIIILGDSLSAAYQINENEGWVALLQTKLDLEHPQWQTYNASISGDTTNNALTRLPALLAAAALNDLDILIIEVGANDGLQAKSFAHISENLSKIVELGKTRNLVIYLVEMRLPPNYGVAYSSGFNAVFHDVALKENIFLIPSFLDNININPALVQADGLHPVASVQPLIMEQIYIAIKSSL